MLNRMKTLPLEEERDRMGPSAQIRFMLANFILGNVPDIDFIKQIFDFG